MIAQPFFRLRVPGSTSNLGPGFDCLGLALSLFLEVDLLGATSDGRHELRGLGGTAEDWPASVDPEENLFFAAFEQGLSGSGGEGGFAFRFSSEIPLARGLGSSGAAVAAGLLLGNALGPRPRAVDQLLPAGIALEGHPDNVAASLHGGCTLCHPAPGEAAGRSEPALLHPPVHPRIGFAVAWPAARLSTKEARAALPARVDFADARENPRRLALLLEGLRTGNEQWLELGSYDRLHERYRLPLIPGAAQALAAARGAGAWAATLSGSGSALIALGPKERTPALVDALIQALEAAGAQAEGRVVEPVQGPPQLEPLSPA